MRRIRAPTAPQRTSKPVASVVAAAAGSTPHSGHAKASAQTPPSASGRSPPLARVSAIRVATVAQAQAAARHHSAHAPSCNATPPWPATTTSATSRKAHAAATANATDASASSSAAGNAIGGEAVMGRDRPTRRAAASMAGGAAKRGGLLPERTPERPTGSVRAMSETEVVVVGSLNQDITVETERRPAGGETVLGRTVATASGGKGANQAVAAARAGARVAMVGCVGADAAGEALLSALRAAGVDTGAVRARDDAPSGTALIVVDDAGENSIVVVPGANALLTAADVERAIDAPTVVLAQLEVPEDAVMAAARAARRLVLNASPVRPLPAALLAAADPLVVNAGEAAAITGAQSADPRELAAAAHALGVRSIVITLGARGACWSTPDGTIERPAPAAEVVDTTGAGDVFAGTLAARLSQGDGPEDALDAAVAAGAAAVGWRGAQEPR